ncbi:hypothetical protein [Dyella sp.]|uniref:hypothetical protein n=1 Tax=Dyella sp. TaxID=1869338 RepID=UPI002FD94FAA
MAMKQPIVLSISEGAHEALSNPDTLPASAVPISTAPGNLLSTDDTGLKATLPDTLPGTAVPISTASGNLISRDATGLFATVRAADTDAIKFAGTGLAANPLNANLKISPQTGNKAQVISGGLYVAGSAVFNPNVTQSIRPGGAATITPRFDAAYDGEQLYLYGQNTTFTVDVSNTPAAISNKGQYTIRIVMPFDGAVGTSFLKFKTQSNNIRDPYGTYISTVNFAYPYGGSGRVAIVDLIYTLGTGWQVIEAVPSIEATQVFAQSVVVGPEGGTCTIDMSALPYYLSSSAWSLQPSVFVTTADASLYSRGMQVRLGSTVIYNGTFPMTNGTPGVPALPSFVAAPTQQGATCALPSLRVDLGIGPATATVSAKLICNRLPLGTVVGDAL